MFERFTDGARRAVVNARVEARDLGHPRVGSEHLLLGLVDEHDGVGGCALITLGASRPEVLRRVATHRSGAAGDPERLDFDKRAKRLLERSLREALHLGDRSIDTDHLALALARAGNGDATRILSEIGIEGRALRARVLELRSLAASRRPQSGGSVAPPAVRVVGVELSPDAQKLVAWSARQALKLGLSYARHGPLPVRMIGGVGNAMLKPGSPRGGSAPALPAPGLSPAACSFCGRPSPECGTLLRGATGALICADCATNPAGE